MYASGHPEVIMDFDTGGVPGREEALLLVRKSSRKALSLSKPDKATAAILPPSLCLRCVACILMRS